MPESVSQILNIQLALSLSIIVIALLMNKFDLVTDRLDFHST